MEVVIAGIGQTEVGEDWDIRSRNMNYRQLTFIVISIFLLAMATTACAGKATEPVLADSVFSGQAFLDVNSNGQIDSADTPVVNATFYVELNGVKAFGDTTDETGNAFILIPGGVMYPVNVSMEAPKDSTLKLITPSTVTVSASTGAVQFLFSSK